MRSTKSPGSLFEELEASTSTILSNFVPNESVNQFSEMKRDPINLHDDFDYALLEDNSPKESENEIEGDIISRDFGIDILSNFENAITASDNEQKRKRTPQSFVSSKRQHKITPIDTLDNTNDKAIWQNEIQDLLKNHELSESIIITDYIASFDPQEHKNDEWPSLEDKIACQTAHENVSFANDGKKPFISEKLTAYLATTKYRRFSSFFESPPDINNGTNTDQLNTESSYSSPSSSLLFNSRSVPQATECQFLLYALTFRSPELIENHTFTTSKEIVDFLNANKQYKLKEMAGIVSAKYRRKQYECVVNIERYTSWWNTNVKPRISQCMP